MSPSEARHLASTFSVAIATEAWLGVGRLSSEEFVRVRDRLAELAATSLLGPGEQAEALEATVAIDGLSVRCRVEVARRIVWLLSISRS